MIGCVSQMFLGLREDKNAHEVVKDMLAKQAPKWLAT